MAVLISKQMVIPGLVKVGTTWLYEYGDDGTFVVPVDGRYRIEMHGGGGGGIRQVSTQTNVVSVASGGGSGELYEVTLTKGEQIAVTVGAGVKTGAGGTTTFGSLSLSGGGSFQGAGNNYLGGTASGSIASDGENTRGGGNDGYLTMVGGKGNINKPNQTYGNGATAIHDNNNYNLGQITYYTGEHGAVIIIYLGKE